METVTVYELLHALPDTPVYAGHKGLGKGVNTISFIDSPSSVEWLNGGEVIVTTAFLFKENGEMQAEFVQKLIEKGVAALGIKMGRYIETLPDSVIEIANNMQFPIFGISFDMVWSEIFSAFYSLRMDKKNVRSILSPKISTFDKLFRASNWDHEAIRSHFLKCIEVAAAIVNNDYDILDCNRKEQDDELHMYCERRRKYHTEENYPEFLMAQAKNAKKIFDISLYHEERLILCTDGAEVMGENELEWMTLLYESICRKNSFIQDVKSIWNNFLKECIIGESDDNLNDYARLLSIQEKRMGVILVFSGTESKEAYDEFKQRQRMYISRKEVLIYEALVDEKMIVLYQQQSKIDHYLFIDSLRKELNDAAQQHDTVGIFVGQPVESIKHLRKSYQAACNAEQFATLLLPNENVIFYRDIEILNQLHLMDQDFSEITFLQQQITSFDACTTLEVYLESGNIKRAAENSFIHDNTMRYRVQKLEKCLNLDLNKPINRLNLLIKIKLWRIAKKEND
ncbi:PucR family transcriptional regulator ligand-binding domain-containing protein [Lachnospiraceae bacterium OttesenSCG-928-D06]|nr:PucR family transcriptional regulator ligand-binding domain-containing protein [Lachnospiraceae bacterium OttesenSCG-928-D06]